MPRSPYSHSIAVAIGQRILALREKRGLSQTDLGERIDISYQQVQKYEKGISGLNIERLFEICRVLEVDVYNLLSDIDELAEGRLTCAAPNEHHVRLSSDELRVLKTYKRIQSPKAKQLARGYLQMLIDGENLPPDAPVDSDPRIG